jgi:hypothetical protein
VLFLEFLILAVLLLIFFQDIKDRSVYWCFFPALAILFVALLLVQHHLFSAIWQASLINFAFLLFQFLIVSIYFSIKNRRLVNIMDELLGWGDILFLLCMACYLSMLNFMFFYIASLVVSLVIWLVWLVFSNKKNKHIPLAGFQAAIFIVVLATDWWIKPFGLTSDAWLVNIIAK